MESVNLVLGAMFLGTRQDERTSFDLLDRFVDAGGTMIDTADCYCFWEGPSGKGGASERVIGAWLAARPGVRDRVLLSTKVGAEPTVPGQWPQHREGLSAKAVRAGCEGSLRRLRTDHIDLYWAHMEDRSVPLAETVGALAGLVAAGTVARLGASNHPVWRVGQARHIADTQGWAGYSALQLHHAYVVPRPGIRMDPNHRFGSVTDETLDYVEAEGLSLWVYGTLLAGSYTRRQRPLPDTYDHPGTTRRLAVLDDVAGEIGVSRNQVVLAWLTGGTPSLTPIVGVSTRAQLDEAFAGVRLRLTDAQRARLDEAR
jgi:aryl-alcohol dehydrogenase-like predicted oxidoreductase